MDACAERDDVVRSEGVEDRADWFDGNGWSNDGLASEQQPHDGVTHASQSISMIPDGAAVIAYAASAGAGCGSCCCGSRGSAYRCTSRARSSSPGIVGR